MKSKQRIVLITVAIMLIVATCIIVLASPLNYADIAHVSAVTDSTVKGYEDRIAALKQEQKNYEKLIKESKQNAESFLKEKEYLDKQIENLNEQIIISNNLLEEYNVAIIEKEGQISVKQSELDTKFEQFKNRLRVLYEDGSVGYLAMIFSSGSVADFLTSLERMTNMLDYDKRTMKTLSDEKTVLSNEKADLESLKANQQSVYDDLKKTEEELKTKSTQAEQFYQSEIKNEEKLNKMLEQAKAEEKKENDKLDAYLKELAKKNNGVYDGGAFSWPLAQSNNIITSKFGTRTYKIWGRWVTDTHRGIDISVPTGTPVYACAAGTVEIAGWSGSYGYYVVISHGSGYTTLYAHNSSLSVKQGQRVNRGDKIALSGSTGNASGPHLHLEIAINGVLQDPLANGILSHPQLIFY